ncbi:MAG: nucleotidyltransferase family protein [Desulfobacterales bacterium]|nr:nucleotidyltransferase family protein [Deltaproteobacteria bacterium]NNK93420.1 nucleotidyltransferase family protein [Desulfobacterales bacterium]
MQAMILAAGFGTRLQPYSLVKPKPLFPILNTPLLVATIDRLKNAGFKKIIVNCHHLRNLIVEVIDSIPGVIIQQEPMILGTAGGLRLALDHLDDEPLLVTNGDIYHTIDYARVYEKHLQSEYDVTMVLHDYPRFNVVTKVGERVLGFDAAEHQGNKWAFTGLQVIKPGVLSSIPAHKTSCIIQHYRALIQKNISIGSMTAHDTNWTDMGTPGDYLNLHRHLLDSTVPVWPEICRSKPPSIYIDARASCDKPVYFNQWACVGQSDVGGRATITRSIIWDGAFVPPKARLSDAIVTPDPI